MLLKIYNVLLEYFGHQYWWPTIDDKNPKFEIMIGAILTQQTTWKNVEKVLKNLKNANLIDPKKLYNLPVNDLENMIRPCGFYKVKAKRLRNFLKYFFENFYGDVNKLFNRPLEELRKDLLSVNGIGPETCDSMILYAGEMPIFVVDAYTYRLCERFPIIHSKNYEEVREFFEKNLSKDVNLFKEFHALIVELGKNFCKIKSNCDECPLNKDCKKISN